MTADEFRALIAARLEMRGESAIVAAQRAGLQRDAIRSVLRGHLPTLPRAAEICAALGLELSIGSAPEAAAEDAAGPLRQAAAVLGRLRDEAEGAARRLTGAPPAPADDPGPPALRQVEVLQLATAAGGGTPFEDASAQGSVAFRRDWLDQNGLDPTQCVVIGVQGESMEPTLANGGSILVDRARRRRRAGGVFVVAAPDGLVVKRLKKDAGGGWLLASDHPVWPDLPWPEGAEIVGEVVWTAQTLRR